MTNASRFYLLNLGLGALGATATLVALSIGLSSFEFSPPALATLASACGSFLLPDPTPGALLGLSLTILGLAVLTLAARSLRRQVRGHHRFLGGLSPVGTVTIAGCPVTAVNDHRPQAFCAGYLRPRIYLSSGALQLLSERQLGAVVAHEWHHLRRRDPMRILLARLLADSIFFMPVLRRLSERYGRLSELAADETAVREAGAGTLAAALLAFGEKGDPAVVVGIARERVDHLLGRDARWELPILLLAGSIIATGSLIAITVGTAPRIEGASLSLPLLMAQSCMMVMTGLAILIGAGFLLFARSLLRDRLGR
jgi:Zn-dependent protease with chaperone function